MNLEDARSAVFAALGRMNILYKQSVFDEWVLAKLTKGQGAILYYQGPRAESYKSGFIADSAPLGAELGKSQLGPGDFVFAPEASGTHFDACIRLGEAGYLFCNNTNRTMRDIRANPLWLDAQKPFVELAAKFHADPLE